MAADGGLGFAVDREFETAELLESRLGGRAERS